MRLGPGGQSVVVLIVVCLGAAIGIGIQKIQPVHHRDDATKDVVKLIMGLMATMTRPRPARISQNLVS